MKKVGRFSLAALFIFCFLSVTLRSAAADTHNMGAMDEWQDAVCVELIGAYFSDQTPDGQNARYYSEGTRKLDESLEILDAMEQYRAQYAKGHPTHPLVPRDQFRSELGKILSDMARRRGGNPDYVRLGFKDSAHN